MSLEKITRLEKYRKDCHDRLSSPITNRSAGRAEGIKEFLKREINKTDKAISDLKLALGGK